jgi:hypothetical protein
VRGFAPAFNTRIVNVESGSQARLNDTPLYLPGTNYSKTGGIACAGATSAADEFTATRTGAVFAACGEYFTFGSGTFNSGFFGQTGAPGGVTGTDSFNPSETASVLTTASTAGADAFSSAETGTVNTFCMVAAADTATFTRVGSVNTAFLVAGADSFASSETGSLTSVTFVSGRTRQRSQGQARLMPRRSLRVLTHRLSRELDRSPHSPRERGRRIRRV